MNTQFCLILATGFSSCANWETTSGPFVNEQAIQQGVDTMERAAIYESQGGSPRDAWNARTLTMVSAARSAGWGAARSRPSPVMDGARGRAQVGERVSRHRLKSFHENQLPVTRFAAIWLALILPCHAGKIHDAVTNENGTITWGLSKPKP